MGVGDARTKATRGEGAAVRSHNQKPKNQGSVDIFVHTPFRKASLDTLVGEQIAGIVLATSVAIIRASRGLDSFQAQGPSSRYGEAMNGIGQYLHIWIPYLCKALVDPWPLSVTK